MPQRAYNVYSQPTMDAETIPDPAPAPNWGDTWEAAFGLENDVQAAMEIMARPVWKRNPNYDIVARLKDSEWWDTPYRDDFMRVESDEEFNYVSGLIKQENKYRDTLMRAGWAGTVAAIGAGVLSPTMFIPLTAGGRGITAVARGAALGAGAAAVQEVPLQMAQATRTYGESLAGIAAGTLIGGVFGGAVSVMTKAERQAIEADMALSPGETTISRPVASGAEVTASADPGKPASGAGAVLRIVDSNPISSSPVTQTLNSDFITSRTSMAKLSDAGLVLDNARLGIPTAKDGTVENNVAPWWGRFTDTISDNRNAYAEYVFGGPGPRLFATTRARLAAYQTQKMSLEDFNKAVFRATFSGEAENEFVEKAAKAFREKIYDFTWEQMKAVKGYGDLTKGGDPGYINWVPDQKKIANDPVGFMRFLADKYNVKMQEDFTAAWEKYALKQARDEEFLEDAARSPEDIQRLRDELGDMLKGVERRREQQHFTALQDTIDDLRAAARQLKGGSVLDEEARRKMLADARDMEKQAGPQFGEAKLERREIKRRLSNLNKATAVLEERLANKLTKIERAEELSEAGLMRIARKGQKILNEMENWTDEKLDSELSKLKDDFERVAGIYDRGEERIVKLAEGDEILEPRFTSAGFVAESRPVEVTRDSFYEGDWTNIAASPGYKYHTTPADNALDIADDDFIRLYDPGFGTDQSAWPDGTVTPRSYWASSPGGAGPFRGEGQSVLLRTKTPMKKERGTSDFYSEAEIPTGQVEYLSRDGTWEPINLRRGAPADEEMLAADAAQQARADRMTAVAERIADAEDLGRDAMRDLIMNMLDESITRVNRINSKRAVRMDRLRKQAADLQPEVVAKRLEERRAGMTTRAIEFRDKWRELGADDLPGPKGDIANGKADFSDVAMEAAKRTLDKFRGTMLRLPVVDMLADKRSSMLPRMLSFISTAEMSPWLNQNIEEVSKSYIRTMSSDIEIAKKFDGEVNAESAFNEIAREEKELLLAIDKSDMSAKKKAKETARVQAQAKQDLHNLEVTVKRLRHMHGLPQNPDGWGYRFAQVAQDLNVLRYMGGVAIASVPDLGRPIMRYGLTRTFRDGWAPFVTGLKEQKLLKREAMLAGVAIEVLTGLRAASVMDAFDDIGRRSKFEQGIRYASQKQGIIAAFSYWTDANKMLVFSVANAKIMDSIAEVMTAKSVSPKTTQYLAHLGFTEARVQDIWNEVIANGGGAKVNGVWLPNTELWKNGDAVQAFRQAVAKEVNNTIITPGVERPEWMTGTTMGRLVGQFKSFGFSSTQKTLMAGLQQRDAAVVEGVMSSLALGALSYYLWGVAGGGERYEKMINSSLETWADEAIDRSGLEGLFSYGRDILRRVPLTAPYASFSGQQSTRRGGADIIESVGGPTLDLMQKSLQVITGIDDPTQATVHAARLLTPYQNVSVLSQAFDAIERLVNENFDIPERRQ